MFLKKKKDYRDIHVNLHIFLLFYRVFLGIALELCNLRAPITILQYIGIKSTLSSKLILKLFS